MPSGASPILSARLVLGFDFPATVSIRHRWQLNRPNDVVVKSDGCIYFTDPWTSPAAPEQWDPNVFRCVSRHPGSRHHELADRRLYRAERPRFFAG